MCNKFNLMEVENMNKKLLALIFGAGLVLAACGGNNNAANDKNTSTNTGTTTETASVDAEKIVNAKCISVMVKI